MVVSPPPPDSLPELSPSMDPMSSGEVGGVGGAAK